MITRFQIFFYSELPEVINRKTGNKGNSLIRQTGPFGLDIQPGIKSGSFKAALKLHLQSKLIQEPGIESRLFYNCIQRLGTLSFESGKSGHQSVGMGTPQDGIFLIFRNTELSKPVKTGLRSPDSFVHRFKSCTPQG